MALRDQRRNYPGGGGLPLCFSAGEVAGGRSNTDRGQHPRIDGAAHRPACSEDSYENFGGPIAARARDAGVRAAVGVPIIIDGRVWGMAGVGSMRPGPMPADTEVRLSRFAELIAAAVVAGYRDEQRRGFSAEGSQRLSLVDALLEGRAFDEWSLRDAAGHLRLPINGPFVVITAQAPTVGDEPLPEIESKLVAWTSFRRGGCCLTCRSGSSTSTPTTNSTGLLPCCLG